MKDLALYYRIVALHYLALAFHRFIAKTLIANLADSDSVGF
jgi:hypothetical protein